MNLFKPWYLRRPSQVARRIAFAVSPTKEKLEISLPWKSKLLVNPNEAIGRGIATTGVWELAVTETIWRLSNDNCLMVDVGANIGYITTLMMRRNCHGAVISVEPHPTVFQELKRNVGLNSASQPACQVELHNIALGSAPGTGVLTEPGGFGSNRGVAYISALAMEGSGIRCSLETLDGILAGRNCRLLKLDVEGYELEVLKGASGSLASRSIEHIVFEDHNGAFSPVCELLRKFDYSIFQIDWTLRGPVAGESLHTRAWESPNFLATLNRQEMFERCLKPGWECLRGR